MWSPHKSDMCDAQQGEARMTKAASVRPQSSGCCRRGGWVQECAGCVYTCVCYGSDINVQMTTFLCLQQLMQNCSPGTPHLFHDDISILQFFLYYGQTRGRANLPVHFSE